MMARRRRWVDWLLWAGVGVGLVWAGGQDVAHGRHVETRPSHATLARIYPELVRPGFRWHTLEARWYRTHPGARAVHRLPYERKFNCIAKYESGNDWSINTGNGYYGGLQMDRTFQRTYAPGLYARKGTANRWTREEQIRAAARAVPSRGFHPWPTTARICGLI